MYEVKKYLKLRKDSLNVIGAIENFNEKSRKSSKISLRDINVYRVVHLKPFNFTEKNILKFLDIIFQGYINISKVEFIGKSEVRIPNSKFEFEVTRKDVSLLLDNVPFHLGFSGDYVSISGDLREKFSMEINLTHNKNNFSIIRSIKKELDLLTDWHFLSTEINKKLKSNLKLNKDFGVGGFVKMASPESNGGEREVGEFVITPHNESSIRKPLGIRNISFKLDGKELKINNMSVDSVPFNIHKDIEHFEEESERYSNIAKISKQIFDEVHWVIFSSRRERRLKQLLEK
ncbi:MAG: hypothetical protein SLAVMIC_00499 [uncultured marine phage]|uniref:Uncharacterized protein n=1 Tax=uncultured marine phage TaxID=707152 RepID=A0A8D9C912_9VIRU|nr:MAG: hypothetical protein SLAVMIC_00499 [uncultured marine phage]